MWKLRGASQIAGILMMQKLDIAARGRAGRTAAVRCAGMTWRADSIHLAI
jgi:hypothetical protein